MSAFINNRMHQTVIINVSADQNNVQQITLVSEKIGDERESVIGMILPCIFQTSPKKICNRFKTPVVPSEI